MSNFNQQIQDVQAQITQVAAKLIGAREKLIELQLTDLGSSDLYRKNIELIEQSKQQLHQIIDQYFKDLNTNYVFLQSKYPNKEIQQLVIKQIDTTFQQLSDLQSKIQNDTFSQFDYLQFHQANFNQVQKEVLEETENLQRQNQNSEYKQHTEENMPYVNVENRIIEGFYLGLNQYATVQWPGETPRTIHDRLMVQYNQYFTTDATFLPLVDEIQRSVTVYDVNTKKVHQQGIKAEGIQLPSNFSLIQLPTGEMYIIGGILNGSIQGSLYHIDVENLQVTIKSEMLVKRVGHSCCYVPPIKTGGVGKSTMGYIYVIGGKTNNNVRTKLCERYNIQSGQWEYIEKMSEARSRPIVVYHCESQSIYVFFGTSSEQQNIHSCQRFDLLNNKWEQVLLQNFLPGFDVTYGCGVVVNKDQILLFGGFRDSMYFRDYIYPNRKLMLFNTHNDSLTVLDSYLPIDFIPVCQPIVNNNSIFCLGSFISCLSPPPNQSMWMEGAFVIEINSHGAKVNDYLDASYIQSVDLQIADEGQSQISKQPDVKLDEKSGGLVKSMQLQNSQQVIQQKTKQPSLTEQKQNYQKEN